MRISSIMATGACAALACASPKVSTDTLAISVDTLGGAVVGATTAAAYPAPPAPGATTATTARPAADRSSDTGRRPADTAKVTRDTTHLGRDSVIRTNPRDPSRQIPTKKPPI